jgi:hypothetical protein
MKKKAAVLFLMMFFIVSAVFSEQASAVVDTPFIRVKVNLSNIRNAPSLQAKIVKTASLNSEYKILGIDGDWFEILLDDSTTGYINKLVCDQIMVKEAKETPPPAESKPAKPVATAAPAQQAPTPAIPEMKMAPAPDNSGFQIAHIGVKFGLNSATINGEGVEVISFDKAGAKWGLCLGGFITIKFSKYLGFQPEILISSKGAIDTLWYEELKQRAVLTYLEFPLLAKLFLPVGDILEPNFFIGPYFSFLIGKKYFMYGQSYEINKIKSSDFGLVFGAGVDVLKKALKIGSLHLDVRYDLGLTNIFDSDRGESKNSAINFMLGFSF